MRARRDHQKLGQATLTDFHKVKVTFVGEDTINKVYEFALWFQGCPYSF